MNFLKRRFQLIFVVMIIFCTAVALLIELNVESWMKNTGFFDLLKLGKATELIPKNNATNLDIISSDDSTPISASRERLVPSVANKLYVSRDTQERGNLPRINESQRKRNLRCGTNAGWQERYLELHNDIIKGKAQPKYLVYRCEKGNCGGYGNRLFGIISLFYLAVLTDRAFLIYWEYPTPLRTYLQPRNIQWGLDLKNIEHLNSSYFWWSSKGVREKQASGLFTVSGNKEELAGWFKKTDFTRLFDRPVVFITLIWNTIYFVKNNSWLRQKALQLGILSGRSLREGEMFGCAFEYLFKTSDIVERKIDLALQELHFERNEFVIGLHIRTWDKASFNTETFDNQTNEYFKCFIAHAEKIKTFLQNTGFVPSIFSWFLATDNMKLKRFVVEHYKKYKTLSLRPRHIVNIDKDDHDEILDVLVDHFMLSRCNFLVLTPGSTFGQTAAGVGMFKRNEFVYVQTCR